MSGTGKGRRLTQEEIETLLATYALEGSLHKAAASIGCDVETVKYHLTKRGSFRQERVRQEKLDVTIEHIIEKCGEVQIKLLEALADPQKIAAARYNELSVSLGIVTDKRELLAGHATSRPEHVNKQADPAVVLTPKELEVAAKIRAKLAGDGGPVDPAPAATNGHTS